jgi:hypothetical protein
MRLTGVLLLVLCGQNGGHPQRLVAQDGGVSAAGRAESDARRTTAQPQLPRELVRTEYARPPGRTWQVSAGDDLQAVLELAQPGETIELDPGAEFRGNFRLPRKEGAGWIYLQSAAYDRLPPPGERLRPAEHAKLLPKIIGVGTAPGRTIEGQFGTHHWRFVGLEITTEHDTLEGNVTNLVTLGLEGARHATAPDQLPHHIIFDRCYLHGTPTGNVRRGILLNGDHLAVVDSHLSDFHEVGSDAQALMAANGHGPFQIANNYLEASTENILIGGVSPRIANLVPADIEIRGNHLAKPWSWRMGDPSYAGIPWLVKNLLELKSARRVLVEHNLLENCWQQAQQGSAILLQGGSGPWASVQDVTIRRNLIQHAASGFRVSGSNLAQPEKQTSYVAVQDNLFRDISRDDYGGRGELFQVVSRPGGGPLLQLTIARNTAIHSGPGGAFFSIQGPAPAVKGLTFNRNIVTHGQYGLKGSGQGIGRGSLMFYFRGYTLRSNLIVGRGLNHPRLYPRGNYHLASLAQIGFTDPSRGDYRLAGESRYQGWGADVPAIMAAADAARRGVRPPQRTGTRPGE